MRKSSTHPSDCGGGARSAGGFTLVEVLIGVVLLGLIAIAVASVSILGVLQMSDDNVERQLDATAAQWASMVFASDVQGASGIAPADQQDCGVSAGVHLVTLVSSGDPTERVQYRSSDGPPYSLVRVDCSGGSRVITAELAEAPEVEVRCPTSADPVAACAPGTAPRIVALSVSRRAQFEFELDGARRTVSVADLGAEDDVFDTVTFLALGGGSGNEPLRVQGNATLRIVGDTLVNAPESGNDAIYVGSASIFEVEGRLAIQEPAICAGCSPELQARIETFRRAMPPPPREAPDLSGLVPRANCDMEGDRRRCEPGIYEGDFPPVVDGNPGVKNFVLSPGIYVLRGDLDLNNGSIEGDEVLFYNETGEIDLGGNITFDLSGPTADGALAAHEGILVFQPESNANPIRIIGNSSLAVFGGTIHAPGSSGVTLGGGNGELYAGGVVGTTLTVFGNGTVIVNG